MPLEATAPLAPPGLRNPANIVTAPRKARAIVETNAAGLALYLEAIWLACGIAAVAGALPLVMLLHR